jgi:DNA-directed RNA polymerase specialized sigma24 family protein
VQRYYLGLSEAEVAEQTGSPVGTVKWRLHAGRGQLKRILASRRDSDEAQSKEQSSQ